MNFKLILEDNLHRIDSFFREKSKKDVNYIYVMVISVIVAISYPFYDLSVNEFESAKERVNVISGKIDADKIFLQVNPESKIVKLDQDIKQLEAQLLVEKENNAYIKSKIEAISELVYDERAWGEYLNSISINAKKYNIKLLNFTNKYATTDEAFGHILDITLDFRGNYSNTLKFINSLEKSDLVVDIHDLSVKAENTLNSRLDISVWGITY